MNPGKLIIACCLLTAALAAYEVNVPILQWRLTKYCKLVDKEGKPYLIIDVPKDAKEAGGQNFATADIDLTPFADSSVQAEVRCKADDVVKADGKYNGVTFMMYFKNADTGVEKWPGVNRRLGSFDWTHVSFSETIPRGAKNGTLRLGLESAAGFAEFDLSTLKIAGFDQLLKDPAAPLSPESAREFEQMEKRLRDSLLTRRAETKDHIRDLLQRQQPDGTFAGIDYKDGNRSAWQVGNQLIYALDMARAWAKIGHPFYHHPELGEGIQKAVGWWAKNRPQSSNWWYNDMFTPQKVTETMLLTPELFPEGPEREAALAITRQAVFLHRYTGNNRVFIAANVFKRAILERNERALNAAAGALSEEIAMAPTTDKTAWAFGGIRADGCYHQHGPQIQFGNYGGEFFSNIGYWANIWKGTWWELNAEQWNIMRHLSFDGFRWVLWKGDMDLLACGRQLGRDAARKKGARAIAAFRDLRNADPGGKAPYDAVLDGNEFSGNRHFWNSDYMVHRRPGWYSAVRMNSVRVRPLEDDTNWDNALGRYLSDGGCLIYRSGEEYRDITGCWDWTRLPGTTLPKTPVYTPEESAKIGLKSGGRPPRWTHSKKWRQIGTTAFTGGVSDGLRGVAVYSMDIDQVEAKKGYFFDTDAIYQLGSDISAASSHEVATTVNSCLLTGKVEQGENCFRHDGVGYRGKGMKLAIEEREGDWRYLEGGLQNPVMVKKNLFTLLIDHGVKPEKASYEFAILPGASLDETANWSKGKTLANTGTIQAVEFNDGTVGAIFYVPGKLGNFETDSPGVFLIGKKAVWAADPSAKLKEMKLTLDGSARTIQLPDREMEGSSVKVTF